MRGGEEEEVEEEEWGQMKRRGSGSGLMQLRFWQFNRMINIGICAWPCIVTVWNLTISLAVYMLDCGIHMGYRCVCICPFTPSLPHSPVSLAPPLWLSWWMLSLYCVVVILVLLGVPLCCRLAVEGCRRRTEEEELADLQNRSWCCIGHAVNLHS